MTDEALRPPGAAEAPGRAVPWPSPRVAWYAVFVLSLTLFINFLDRSILNLLVRDIKADLSLSDTQWSLVSGFAFAALYALVGLPIARMVDSGSRKTILSIGVAIWSLTTALTGLTRSFGQLFVARVGVGVGEACTGPATFSMLSDFFPRERLARAIAVLQFGYMIGNGLAGVVGGTIILLVAQMSPWDLPFIGDLHPWQRVLVLVGVVGLVVAAMMLTVPEPERRDGAGNVVDKPKAPPLREVVAFLTRERGVYFPMLFGAALKTVMSFGAAVWVPAFYMRTFDWSPAKVGLVGGSISLIVAPLGALTGAYLAERWTKQGQTDAYMRVVVWSSALLCPAAVAFPLMPTDTAAVALAALSGFIAAWVLGPQNAALQIITPNQMRGQISAVWLFIFNVIGFGCGPFVVSFFTDFVFKDEARVGWSLATVAAIIGPLATYVLWRSLKPYGAAVAKLGRQE
jgi:MFS family permease